MCRLEVSELISDCNWVFRTSNLENVQYALRWSCCSKNFQHLSKGRKMYFRRCALFREVSSVVEGVLFASDL